MMIGFRSLSLLLNGPELWPLAGVDDLIWKKGRHYETRPGTPSVVKRIVHIKSTTLHLAQMACYLYGK